MNEQNKDNLQNNNIPAEGINASDADNELKHTANPSDTAENADNTKKSLPTEDVNDYVYAHYRKRRHRDRHRTYHSSTKKDYTNTLENENTQVVYSTSATHYRDKAPVGSRRHRWRKKPWWKKLLIVLAWIFGVLLALLLIAAIAFLIMRGVGMKKLTNYESMDMTAPVVENAGIHLNDNGKSVFYNGKEYKFNEDVTSIMCIGVDRDTLGVSSTLGTGGQGDALYLIALDTDTGETTIIGVPRDIVTDIGIYSSKGEYMRTEKHQICLAYAYGDGRKTSCLNTVTAVSRLFYQLPINSYFSIDISAIAKLNNAVGGVRVTMIDNSFYDTDLVQHFEGETLTLWGDNARKYVQHRDVNRLESSSERMQRQINYLNSFTKKALSKTKKDLKTPIKLLDIINKNSETNLDATTITAFASCLVTNGVSEVEFTKVPGHLESDGTYAQYIVDEAKLYEMILDTYYTPVE